MVSYTTNLLKEVDAQFNIEQDPLKRLELSFLAHFNLVSIHPFYDGNGRTTRLFMNYIQQKAGLPLGIVFKEDRKDYIQALTDSRQKEDVSIFTGFMYGQYSKFLQEEIKKAKEIKTKNHIKKNRGSGLSIIF